MTERKPPEVSFESWIDKQIRLAQERGDFDNLPGAGKPIPLSGDVDDELWWVKGYLRRENLPLDALLPTPLQLRKQIERLPETVRGIPSEDAVREIVHQLNLEIVAWLRAPSGPRVPVSPVDADEVVSQWRMDRRAVRTPPPSLPPSVENPPFAENQPPTPRPRRWWRRGR
ncbi:DUF1992 domain-containing protein [Rhodococcus sp. USK13]|jgi:hypothetical protein|uniref:DnaJ family domain-containing protein n=1 Tax=Rhodococcus sp. USK13 TaxID=2806442 RepID=UPI001BD0365F|nr:DUF1992 domain-containing protein [Rhodococcus sp. USK13]